jgi:hypothetical protein
MLQKTVKKKEEEIAALRMELERLNEEYEQQRSQTELEASRAAEAEEARRQVGNN